MALIKAFYSSVDVNDVTATNEDIGGDIAADRSCDPSAGDSEENLCVFVCATMNEVKSARFVLQKLLMLTKSARHSAP